MNLDNYYVNTRKAAQLLGYGEYHTRVLSVSGKLPGAIKKSGQWKIPLSGVEEFQKQQKELVSREAQVEKILRPYLLAHLGKACEDFADTQGSVVRGIKFPDRSEPEIKEQVKKVRDQQLAYIEKILADLRSVKVPDTKGSQV